MKNYYNIILSLTILSLLSVGWGQSNNDDNLIIDENDNRFPPSSRDLTSARDLLDCVCDSEYSVGDRVICIEDYYDHGDGDLNITVGMTGTIVCGNSDGIIGPLVMWDDWYEGHDNDHHCDCGNGTLPPGSDSGWFVYCNNIELLESDSGCTNESACNYDPDATEDDGSCEYEEDCAGQCGGDAEIDECDVCNGDGSSCSGSVYLEIQNVNLTEGTLDVYMTNTVSIAGFQFFISGITISNISGGVSADYFDILNVNNFADCDGDGNDDLGCNLILGASTSVLNIPEGTNQLLLTASFTDFDGVAICFTGTEDIPGSGPNWSSAVFSDSNAQEIDDVTWGDCYENDDNWVYGCTYENATNYNPDATFDDGSCDFMWGDVNHDGVLTIQDLILIVNEILNF